YFVFFFFQAEDGIRDDLVTGVQTCALPILASALQFRDRNLASFSSADKVVLERGDRKAVFAKVDGMWRMTEPVKAGAEDADLDRSEERRVGKEGRGRGARAG